MFLLLGNILNISDCRCFGMFWDVFFFCSYFNDEEIQKIHEVTLRSIILNVTTVEDSEIQEDVFIHSKWRYI